MTEDDLNQLIGDGLERATRHQFAGETEAAIQTLEKLEQLARPREHPGLVYVLIQKAGWLRELGRSEEARSALEEAESLCLKMPRTQAPLSSLRMEQGIVAHRQGDLPKAESLFKEAQELARGSPSEVVVMSDILANLSMVYADQGRLEEAQTALSNAIEYDFKTGDPRALASNLNMLGLSYMTAGDGKTAREYFKQSKAIAGEAGLAKELADATHNLAIVSEKEGHHAEARAGFMAALEAATSSGRAEDIASAKTSLGIIAARDGRFQEAKELFTTAHEIHSRLGLAEFSAIDLINLTQIELSLNDAAAAFDHANAALGIAEQRGLMQILWAVHYCVAKAQLALLGQDTGSKSLPILNGALASYAKAADAIDILRAGIGRPEEREQLLVDKEMIYEQAMLLAGLLRRGTDAWTFVERSRARAFLDSLGAARIEHQAEKHPLAARRSELTRQLLEQHNLSAAERESLLEELRLVRSGIIAAAPAIAAVTEAELPSIPEVAAAIPPDTAIVEFFLGPGAHLTVFVLNQKGLAAMHTLDLGTVDLTAKIEQFRAELQYGVAGEPTGEFLFTLLFSPVWDVLAPVGRLLIVPHRELHYLPFAALWFHNSGEGPEHLYLCQRFQTSILPSTSYLLHVFDLPLANVYEGHALVMGNPTKDLPASETEAKAVSRLLKATPLLRARATRNRVLATSKRYNVIHIASHGIYDKTDPLLSGMLLADGRLSVEDLLEARIPASLLTLSGCVTGISSQAPGDELIGLSRAALAAGVPSVITTLWEVPDDSTGVFFERFYGHLCTGMSKDEALLVTQHDMLGDPQYSSPAKWAPYVLLGDHR